MRELIRAVLMALVWSCASLHAAAADQPGVTDQQTGAALAHQAPQGFLTAPDGDDPFDRLFEPPVRRDASPAPIQPPMPERQPRTICGMVVVPADPSIDPQMQLEPPEDARFTLRTVQPQICGPE